MNLKEAYEIAFDSRDSWREGKGAKTARINANHVIRVLGADMEVGEIDTIHFTQLTKQLQSEGKAKATINRITCSLRTLLSELNQLGHKFTIPSFKRQKESQGRVEFYTEDEINSLLTASEDLGDFMLLHDSILFSYKTGCRRNELLELRLSDVDLEAGVVTFRDTKNGSDHHLPIHKDLVPVLERRLHMAVDSFVFPWNNGDQLLGRLRSLQSRCGVDSTKCWHTIRHTTATQLVSKGAELRKIMGVLNHKSVSTTLRYAKVADDAKKEAIDLL